MRAKARGSQVRLQVRYLTQRGESFGYRREIPQPLRVRVGKREWVASFGRIAKEDAIRKCRELGKVHDALIRRLRDGETMVLDQQAIEGAELEARELLKLSARDRADVLAAWQDDAMDRAALAQAQRGNKGHAAFAALEALYSDLGALFEAHGTPHQRATLNAMRNAGRFRPEKFPLSAAYARDKAEHANGRDERPYDLAVRSFKEHRGDLELLAITRADVTGWVKACRAAGQTDSTIRRRSECLAAILKRYQRDNDLTGPNPFGSLGLSTGSAFDRLPLHSTHIKAIDDYMAGARLKSSTRHILVALKWTGARPAEIAGLAPADVILQHAVPHIWIRPNVIRPLKTKASERRVPLIGDALTAMEEAMKSPAGNGVFFSEFNPNSLSATLNQVIRRAGVPRGNRLSVYGYRHAMKEALRSAVVRDDLQRRLLGHAGEGIADRYGAPLAALTHLRDALSKAMPHLGDVEESIYAESALVTK